LSEGDGVSVTLRADLVDDDYVWRWDTRVTAACDPSQVKARFRQSTFYGAPISLDKLKRREAGYVPPPAEDARIDGFVLSRLDGQSSLGEIATELCAGFPQRFARQQDALTRAADVAQRYAP
jgi:protein arginine N-methyltransferase 1